jgi:hypothetical protein
VMGIFCISGHTLGGMIAMIMVLAWVVWGLIYRTSISKQLLVIGALGMGLLVGGIHYFQAYHETGNFMGLKRCIVMRKNTEGYGRKLPSVGVTNLRRMAMLAGRDRYRISIPGTICSIITVILGLKFRRKFRRNIPLFIGLLSLTTMTPFMGIYDFDIYRISDWFIQNFRYQLHWYPFAVVCIAMLFGYSYRWMAFKNSNYIKIWAAVGLGGLTFVLAISAYDTISSKWRTRNKAKEWIEASIIPLQSILQKMPIGKNLLLEDLRYNYYLGNRAIILYSSPTCKILRGENEEQVNDALKDLNIVAVALKDVITNRNLMGTAFFDLLRNPLKASLRAVIKESSMHIYIIDEK